MHARVGSAAQQQAMIARTRLSTDALVRVLEAWCPPMPGLFLYYPGHRHVPAGLKAFVAVLRELT